MIPSSVMRQKFLDASGNPLVGGKLYSYAAGTTTPQVTYSDSAGTSNANPVVLDSSGEANVWLDPVVSYKFVLKDSTDVTLWTVDNFSGLIADGTVTTAKLAAGSVTTVKIADDAVTAAKLADDAVTDANRAVTTNHIRDSAVTTAKIADANVTTVKILDANVTTAKIADANVTTVKIADANVTRAKLVAVGHQISSTCGTFSTTSTADITNLSVTITTTGRPVMLMLVSDGSGSGLGSGIGATTNTSQVKVYRDANDIATILLNSTAGTLGVGVVQHLDAPVAGTYVYKLRAVPSSSTVFCNYSKLVAYEL